ncbi:MAG TPA: SRPBCC family protein [Burkholderiales bacterium]
MKIENSFHVPASLEESWQIVTDVPSLVACMPGAELTEVAPDGAYRGVARVTIGPVALQFNGEARLYDVDARAHTMKVRSRASDAKGRGTVASEMAFALVPEGDRTRVDVVTDLTLTGAVAQYGRGTGLIREVANEFTRDFAANLEKMVLTKTKIEAAPASGLRLFFSALRALLGRWLGRGRS